MTESTRTLAEARAWCEEQRRVASGNQAPLPTGVQYVESLIARLDQPCGSCHPCTNYADETWRAAGRTPPHVYEWDEAQAARKRISELHSPQAHGDLTVCGTCPDHVPYPCPTIRAQDGGV